MEKEYQLTIGIPTFNGGLDLENCLKSIRDELSGMNIQVIVVDDAKSTRKSDQMVSQILPEIGEYYWDAGCFGIAQATNTIVQNMKSDYLLRLDSDVIVRKDTVEAMENYMNNHTEVGVLAPRLTYLDNSFQPSYETHLKKPYEWFGEYFLWGKKLFNKLFKTSISNTADLEPFEVAYMASAVVMIRKEAIDKVGSVDSEMEFYMEDADWIIRIGQAGYQIIYWPAISMIHLGGHSGTMYIHCRDRSIKNLYYFYQKHFPGKVNQTVLKIAVLAGSFISLAIALFFAPFSYLKPKWREIDQRAINSFMNVFRWHIRRPKEYKS